MCIVYIACYECGIPLSLEGQMSYCVCGRELDFYFPTEVNLLFHCQSRIISCNSSVYEEEKYYKAMKAHTHRHANLYTCWHKKVLSVVYNNQVSDMTWQKETLVHFGWFLLQKFVLCVSRCGSIWKRLCINSNILRTITLQISMWNFEDLIIFGI